MTDMKDKLEDLLAPRPYNPWADGNGEGLFEGFIERKPRCRAVQLSRHNVWTVVQWLVGRGHSATAGWGADGELLLEVTPREACDSVEAFIAKVDEGDAIVLERWNRIVHIPGQEFRAAWEKEIG